MLGKKKIRFNGTKEVESMIKNQTDNVISHRFKIMVGVIFAIGLIFIVRLFVMQIGNGDYYGVKLKEYNTNTFKVDSSRGEIYDRNYKKLVSNKNVICATYYSVKNIKKSEIEAICKFLVEHVNVSTSDITDRDKRDYLIAKDPEYVATLITDEEKSDMSKEDDYDTLYYNLLLNRITDDVIKEKLSDYDLKFYRLFYLMQGCTSGSTTLIEDINIEEASIIGENSNILRGINVTSDWVRGYEVENSFKQVLGKVTTKKQGLPADLSSYFLALDYRSNSRVGTSGLESQYESILSGESAIYTITYDNNGNPLINVANEGQKGEDIRLTIDWEIQKALEEEVEYELKIHTETQNRYNDKIFVCVMNPNNGDIIAMVGKNINRKTGKIYDYAEGNYLEQTVIGSTMKGATIYTAFKNGIITPYTYQVDEPLYIQGTPVKKSYRTMGRINEVQALARSSNVYMFKCAIKLGGGTYRANQPLDIDTNAFQIIRQCAGELGLGVKTGLDVPKEEVGYRGPLKDPGYLLDLVIGQYDTYTNIQLAQYVSTIANGGKRIQPHLYLDSFRTNSDGEKFTTNSHTTRVLDDVSDQETAFKQIQEGFRGTVAYGTGNGTALSACKYKIAGKSGTAEVYHSGDPYSYSNHLFIGYAPYDDPQVAVSCTAVQQPTNNSCTRLTASAVEKYLDKYGTD